MKVVQINSVCGVGSTGRIVLSISEVSNECEIENYILYGCGESSYPYAESLQSKTYLDINILKTRLFGKHGFYSQLATKRLLKRLEELQPDVLHLHNIHGHYLNVKMLFHYIKKKNIKVIWTLHDCWAFTGHCAYFDYVGCEKWEKGCHACPQKKGYPISWFFDRSRGNFSAKKKLFCDVEDLIIVTPSIWLKNLVEQSFLKEYPVKVINNGIDLEKFKVTTNELKTELGLENKKIILGICFQLYDRKGGKYLIELAKKLDADKHMVILGLTTEEKLPNNITVLPRTNSVEELVKIYNMADVFVNPTLEDNFPTVNLEALACGTPVVTFATGGSGEAVDEDTGYVVAKQDSEALFEKVEQVLQKDREVYRKACRTRAEQNYSDRDKFMEYIGIYKDKRFIESER